MTVLDFEKIVPLKSEPFPFTELQTKWIEALESGEYKQGRSWLRNGGFYCCLGVLCEVGGLVPYDKGNGGFFVSGEFGGAHSQMLPSSFAKAAGLHDCYGGFERPIPTIGLGLTRSTLVALNDRSPQVPFAEIAQYLRFDPWNVFQPVTAPVAA